MGNWFGNFLGNILASAVWDYVKQTITGVVMGAALAGIVAWLQNASWFILAPIFIVIGVVINLLTARFLNRRETESYTTSAPPVASMNPSTLAIEIEVTSPANQASESWLEWLHIEVSPKVGSQAENLIASIQVDKRVHEARWRGDSGPVEERTCRADRPGVLPIVLRSQMDTTVMGTQIQAGRCYITDINFQIHKVPAVRVNTGAHKVFVMVRGKEGQAAKREFRLIVPAELYEPIRLEPV